MRKNVIYSIPCKRRGILQFYFKAHDKTYYLYYIRYRKKAHEFFRYGFVSSVRWHFFCFQ